MSSFDGVWDSVSKSPMGDQKSVLTLVSEGNSLSGSSESSMGKTDFSGGVIDGDKASWTIELTVPMKMTLEAEATVTGDTFEGTMKMGMFGTFPMSATKRA